jgi:hypothetical protein
MVGKARFLLRAVLITVPVVVVFGLIDFTASQPMPISPDAPVPASGQNSPGFTQVFLRPPPEPATTSKPATAPIKVRGYYQVITSGDDRQFGRIMNHEYYDFWNCSLHPSAGSIDMQPFTGKFCEFTGRLEGDDPVEGHLFRVEHATIIASEYFIVGTVTNVDQTLHPEMSTGVDWQIADEDYPAMASLLLVFNKLSNAALPDGILNGKRYRATGHFTSWGHKGLGLAFECSGIVAAP